jgi:hypothetical protein
MRDGACSKASSHQPSCDEGQQPELASQTRIVSRNGLCRTGAIRLAIRDTNIDLRRLGMDWPEDRTISRASEMVGKLKQLDHDALAKGSSRNP